MKPAISAILQLGLFAAMAFWLMSGASAQIPGPGQVGGMGQGGAPAGEFASDRGNAITGQRNTPTGDFPAESFPKNKDAKDKNKKASSDSSSESSSEPEKRSAGDKAGSSIDPSAADKKPSATADTDAQRK